MDKGVKQDFGYQPTSSGVSFSFGDSNVNRYAQEDRYGDLFERVMNK